MSATEKCWTAVAFIESSIDACSSKQCKDGLRVRKIGLAVMAFLFIFTTAIYYTSYRALPYVCDCKEKMIPQQCRVACSTSEKVNLQYAADHNKLTETTFTPTSVKPTFHPETKKDQLSDVRRKNEKQKMDTSNSASTFTLTLSTTLPTKTKPHDTTKLNLSTTTTTTTTKQKVETTSKQSSVHSTTTTRPLATMRTTTTGPKTVGNINKCKGCLAGKKLIAVQKGWICGATRLGNKMFMIAAAIGAATAHNMTYVMVKKDENCGWSELLQDLFLTFNTSTPLLPYSMMEKWENLGESGFTNFNPVPSKPKNFTIAGYRQTWKYFSSPKQINAVRQAFKFNDKYLAHATNTLTEAKLAYPNITKPLLIGLHMRIGDLVGNSYGYQMANKSFYDTVLKVATSYFNESKNIIFITASDSPDLGKKMLADAQAKYNIYWLHGSSFEDFATLCKCSHSIMSGGTFGFWTGWLTPGKTFYFNNFARSGSAFASGFNNKMFHVPSWIPVSWS